MPADTPAALAREIEQCCPECKEYFWNLNWHKSWSLKFGPWLMYYAFTGQAVLRCSDNKRAGIAHRQQELSSLFSRPYSHFSKESGSRITARLVLKDAQWCKTVTCSQIVSADIASTPGVTGVPSYHRRPFSCSLWCPVAFWRYPWQVRQRLGLSERYETKKSIQKYHTASR